MCNSVVCVQEHACFFPVCLFPACLPLSDHAASCPARTRPVAQARGPHPSPACSRESLCWVDSRQNHARTVCSPTYCNALPSPNPPPPPPLPLSHPPCPSASSLRPSSIPRSTWRLWIVKRACRKRWASGTTSTALTVSEPHFAL